MADYGSFPTVPSDESAAMPEEMDALMEKAHGKIHSCVDVRCTAHLKNLESVETQWHGGRI